MAAVTQTLLSTFGSKFVSPQTGITMNNGIMWFDPTPGHAEFAGAGQALPDQLHAGAGAGGRRPPHRHRRLRRPAHPAGGTQLLSFVMDYGMDLDAAIHQPRIDASEGAVVIGDVRLPKPTREKRCGARFDYEEARMQTMPMKFACPSVVLRDGVTNSGATERSSHGARRSRRFDAIDLLRETVTCNVRSLISRSRFKREQGNIEEVDEATRLVGQPDIALELPAERLDQAGAKALCVSGP